MHALDRLNERLAAGEIGEEEYRARRDALSRSNASAAPEESHMTQAGNLDRGVGFGEAFYRALRNYGVFSGRSSRSAYWYFGLWNMLIWFAAEFLDAQFFGTAMAESGPIYLISTLFFLVPGISVAARRLHDVNRSGWWLLISLTLVGLIPLLYWAVLPGDEGENDFGPDLEA